MTLEERVLEALASLDAGRSVGLPAYAISRRIEELHPLQPLFFGRWGPRWRGVVGIGSLYLAFAHLQQAGKIECLSSDDRWRYRLPAER